MESSSCESCLCTNGCGCNNQETSNITVSVTPTTGGQFELAVTKTDSIENLKKLISKRLKVPKERICLLHRERQLRGGSVQENHLVNGSRLTLLPSVETGLLAQRPEQSVMQALESLNDSQVNDFLSGKAPLNLTMRLGDHMMLIQLQLSTVAPVGSTSNKRHAATVTSTPAHKSPPPLPPSPVPSSSSSIQLPAALPVSATSSSALAATVQSSDCSCTTPPTTPSTSSSVASSSASSSTSTTTTTTTTTTSSTSDVKPILDTRALAEASRNLTQTLKQLSSEVLTSKSDVVEEATSLKRRQGAIIESMHHHGKGVYSGTFSGTLNPALQDRFGRPKRDISTIIHILNDLLCATPQYRAVPQESAKPQPPTSSVPPSTSSCIPELSNLGDRTESDENRATRGKMERLRLVLGQRRERRRAMRAQPYPTGHDHVTA